MNMTPQQSRAYWCAISRGATHGQAIAAAREDEVSRAYRGAATYGPRHTCTTECE